MKTKKQYIAPQISVEDYQTEEGYASSLLSLEFDLFEGNVGNQETWAGDEQIGDTDPTWF